MPTGQLREERSNTEGNENHEPHVIYLYPLFNIKYYHQFCYNDRSATQNSIPALKMGTTEFTLT